MCYSMKLDESLAHLEYEQPVYVGFKVVVRWGNTYMPWMPFCDILASLATEIVGATRTIYPPSIRNTHNGPLLEFSEMMSVWRASVSRANNTLGGQPITSFPARSIVEVPKKSHPFHVEGSEEGCITDGRANPFKFRAVCQYEHRPYPAEMRPSAPSVLCRVLVPGSAVEPDGHVRALMLIPEDEHETDDDIRTCAAWGGYDTTERRNQNRYRKKIPRAQSTKTLT